MSRPARAPPSRRRRPPPSRSPSGPLEGDIVGKGYAFDLPDGWSDTTKKAKTLQATIDTAATEDNPSNGFADNLNVGYNNVGEATLTSSRPPSPTS